MDERFELVRRALFSLEKTGELPALSLSPSAFHRLFVRYTGITPKDFSQQLALVRARQLLRAHQPVMASALEVGLSGSGRLHDLFVRHAGMTPGEYKSGGAGLRLRYAMTSTPFGQIILVARPEGICALRFFDGSPSATLKELRAEWPQGELREDARGLAPQLKEVLQRLRGQITQRLNLAPQGSAFQLQVWDALMRIPEGRTTTYGEIALFLDRPAAARAVGTAIGKNPIGLLIPCHRVIRATGAMGGYRWDEKRKRLLLARESAMNEKGQG